MKFETTHKRIGHEMIRHILDFEGMMAGYSQFFGTKEQPNKPARTTVQVVLPAGDRGGLVDINFVIVRPKQPSPMFGLAHQFTILGSPLAPKRAQASD